MKTKFNIIYKAIRYIRNEIFTTLFFILGGIYLVKLLTKNKKILVIINYHNFSKYNNYKINRGSILETVNNHNFEKQIRFFKKHFSFCFPEEFFSGKGNNGINILINFDDGYKDNYELAIPLLSKYNAKSIFFITTKPIIENDFIFHDKIRYLIQQGLLGVNHAANQVMLNKGKYFYSDSEIIEINRIFKQEHPGNRLMMNITEISEIAKSDNFRIGNHTHDHMCLNCSYDQQFDSIYRCNQILQNISGRMIEHISYPNGLCNDETMGVLRKLNIKFGYTINGGVNDVEGNQYLLKRIGINVSDSTQMVALKMFAYLTFKKDQLN